MTENPIETEVFDIKGFVHRMMGDEDLAREIMMEYLQDMDDQVDGLKEDCRGGDMPLLVRLAHTIKGASANVGAKRMQQTALLAEQTAAKGDRETYIALVPQIASCLTELKLHLKSTNALDLGKTIKD